MDDAVTVRPGNCAAVTRGIDVDLAHFTMNGYVGGLFPGVERVILHHQKILAAAGWPVRIVTGATDHPSPEEPNLLVAPELRSGRYPRWIRRTREDAEEMVSAVYGTLLRIFGNSAAVVFHNTTNAPKHNFPFGVAARMFADNRTVDRVAPTYLWVHDIPNQAPEIIDLLLPTERDVRLICVSPTRKREVNEAFERIASALGVSKRQNDVTVIPNPVSEDFFASTHPVPGALADLAPRFCVCTHGGGPAEEYDIAEAGLFSDGADVVRFLVAARIVEKKGIEHAIRTARAFAETFRQSTILIVTGAPDLRAKNCRLYWDRVRVCAERSRSPRFQAVFLGGVEWQFMPWLYSRAHLLLAPFNSEGFGLAPVEAAVKGLPAVVSDDPALIETTDGNALRLRGWTQARGNDARYTDFARQVHRHLSSTRPAEHVDQLRARAVEHYSSDSVARQLTELMPSR